MNTLHLKYILEVEKMGSISKAAENLYMNQPQLSKAIKDLEETIGISIFKRSSKGVVPTTKGAEFIMYAKGIIAQVERVETLFNAKKSDVLIFDAAVARSAYISQAFSKFLTSLDKNEQIKINYRETNPIRAIKNVATGENNIGIIRYNIENERYFIQMFEEKELRYELLWEYTEEILVSCDSQLAKKDKVTAEDLEGFIEVDYGDDAVPFLPPAKAKKKTEAKENKRYISVYERAGLYDVLKAEKRAFARISPAPNNSYDDLRLKNIPYVGEGGICRDVAFYRQDYRKTEPDKKFIEIIKEIISSI